LYWDFAKAEDLYFEDDKAEILIISALIVLLA